MDIYGTLAGCLVVGALGCLLLFLLQWCKRKSSPASPPLPPGSFGFLWVSETFNYLRALHRGDPSSFVRERTAKFGSKTFKTCIFFHPTVILQGVAANRFITVAENKQLMLNSWPTSILEIMGEHIPPAKHGVPHRRLRQIMASCLGPLALRKLVSKADLMTHLHFETCWQAQRQISLVSLIKQHTFNITCSLLASAEDEALVARLHRHFKVWTAGSCAMPINLPGTAFHKAKNAKQILEREMSKLIDCKQEVNAENKSQEAGNEDMLCMLLSARDENGSFLNREELQDVMLFLLFAGHDTSANTLSFVLKFLEHNPACYHRLCQEHKVIASRKSLGERLDWVDVQNMKYTWAVIQETLRLRPVVPGGFKEVKEDLNFDGYKIPRGWKVKFFMSSTHEDETIFQEPSSFDPSRFDIKRVQDGHPTIPYAYIPFGIGPHLCPGSDFARMIMSIYLHHLALGQFKWKSIDLSEELHILPVLELAKDYVADISLQK